MAIISPSILSSDFSNLHDEIKKVEYGGADLIHIDVMDGIFVPNITFGPPVIKKIRKVTSLPFDVHLMIDRPERYIKDFVDAGADLITVHEESTVHLHRAIQQIKDYDVKVGVALNPSTPLESIKYILDMLDIVLIMTVNPGFGGQAFIEPMEHKIKELRKIIDENNLKAKIEIDGGVKLDNAKEIIDWGADILVAGSAIFGSENIIDTTKEFVNI
jgi:ribulose-phosphate 3-epimerase